MRWAYPKRTAGRVQRPGRRAALIAATAAVALVLAAASLANGHLGGRSPARARLADDITGYYTGYLGWGSQGGPYTSVSASWTEPNTICEGAYVATDFWVGLQGNVNVNGVNAPVIVQIGTSASCPEGSDTAFYENGTNGTSGSGDQTIKGVTVMPGDSISASVTNLGSGGMYSLTISDNTQGWSQQETEFGGPLEDNFFFIGGEDCDPACDGGVTFGSITFTNAQVDGAPLGAANPQAMTPDGGGPILPFQPGQQGDIEIPPLSPDGTSFTINQLECGTDAGVTNCWQPSPIASDAPLQRP